MRRHFLSLLEKCRWCRELYDALTPWVQITGFIILCAFTAGTAWAQFSAQKEQIAKVMATSENNTNRITVLENQYNRIDQKLDDIKDTLASRRH